MDIPIESLELRPWGSFEFLLDYEEHYKVKRLTIAPGQKTSLQAHDLRDEYWVFVEGQGEIEVETDPYMNGPERQHYDTFPGFRFHVPRQKKHRIINNSDAPVVLIEVQMGVACQETDIKRYEDDYGRV